MNMDARTVTAHRLFHTPSPLTDFHCVCGYLFYCFLCSAIIGGLAFSLIDELTTEDIVEMNDEV